MLFQAVKSGLLELFYGGALKSLRDEHRWASTPSNVLRQRTEKPHLPRRTKSRSSVPSKWPVSSLPMAISLASDWPRQLQEGPWRSPVRQSRRAPLRQCAAKPQTHPRGNARCVTRDLALIRDKRDNRIAAALVRGLVRLSDRDELMCGLRNSRLLQVAQKQFAA